MEPRADPNFPQMGLVLAIPRLFFYLQDDVTLQIKKTTTKYKGQ